jgi:N-acyl homoserine lactone hydrolase
VVPATPAREVTVALRIRAVNTGVVFGLPKPALTYMRHFGETQDVPLIMFVIEGGDRPVIVDTGGDPARARDYHGFRMEQAPEQRPGAALRALDVDPADVRIVINTHLHWDHSSNNHLFPHARVVVQQRELDYAVNPVPWHNRTFETLPGQEPAWMRSKDRVMPVDGDAEVALGVSVVALPGHTPGSQGVLVECGDHPYLIAGDCVYTYENWSGDDEAAHIPAGLYTDLIAYEASFQMIEHLDCEVIPSHDFEVLERGLFT